MLEELAGLESTTDRFLAGKNGGKPVVLYGAGFAMPAMFAKLQRYGFTIAAICDSQPAKWGQPTVRGFAITSPDAAMEKHPDATIVIAAPTYYWELLKELRARYGAERVAEIDLECAHYFDLYEFRKLFDAKRVRFEALLAKLEDDGSRETYTRVIRAHLSGERKDFEAAYTGNDDWYLFRSLLKPTSNTTYLDCGAFDGDTVKLFQSAANEGYSHIYAFEPSPEALPQLHALAASDARITVIEKGVYDKDGVISFTENGVYSTVGEGKVGLTKTIEIPVATIDGVLQGRPADIIKMDIEGAEYEALLGARATITAHKPRLAICIYHQPIDFLRIAELLLQMVPEYKLRVRHQSPSCTDTILFASLE